MRFLERNWKEKEKWKENEILKKTRKTWKTQRIKWWKLKMKEWNRRRKEWIIGNEAEEIELEFVGCAVTETIGFRRSVIHCIWKLVVVRAEMVMETTRLRRLAIWCNWKCDWLSCSNCFGLNWSKHLNYADFATNKLQKSKKMETLIYFSF